MRGTRWRGIGWACVLGVALAAVGCLVETNTSECASGLRCPTDAYCADDGKSCITGLCGNGRLDVGEVCDDGNDRSMDGCRADCLSDEKCGNGVHDPQVGEECDDGNQATDDSCLPNCERPRCGDGYLAEGELCDDGNNESGDSCSATCDSLETCGNGIRDIFEECDTLGETESCTSTCTISYCGDDLVNVSASEECDSGGEDTELCNHDCRIPTCGDGHANLNAPNTGTLDIPDDLEECDSFGLNSATCDEDCTLPVCGDGILNEDALNTGTPNIDDDKEVCDTGGVNTARCDSDCTLPVCGDGIFNEFVVDEDGEPLEECDTGGDTLSCDDDCTLPKCGDGNLNRAADEECERHLDCGSGRYCISCDCF